MVFAKREKEERGGRMEKDSWLAGVDFTCSSGGREGHIMFARERERGSDCFTRDTRDEERDERKGSLYVHKVLFIGVYGRSYGQIE